MKIKSAKFFRFWYKTEVKEIEGNDPTHNENFVGTYYKENGKKSIKGFFEMYHGDKPDIASYLPSILKIAEDGQAIYEFLQNAVDCGSTHFYIFYNESYFLAINNGSPFDIEGLQSILNIAQTTKKDPDKIGRFGIGFKLAHRLVGKNEGTDELVRQYKGPILFSWSKLEDLESLLNNEPIEPITPQKGVNNGYFDAPYLLKLLLTNFPADPNETVKDINYKDKILFPKEELNELIAFLNENFKNHSDSLKKNVLNQGSLFFIKLGEEKKKLLDKDYSELVNGIQYSMNTLKRLQKVYINNDDIGKMPLQLEEGIIQKGSDEFEKISPEYKEFDIKFAVGFNSIKFGNDKSYEQIKLLKAKPNFYKYFPMGDEINGFGFIVHCDSFSNEANRRKLHEDDVNRNLFPVLAKHITKQLAVYKERDRNKFLNLYASLLLSDIPDRQNNKWLRPIFYDVLLNSLQKNVPTKNGFSDNAQNVKINKLKLQLNLSDFGLSHIHWFEWDNEADKFLIDEATKSKKLGIEEWDIKDLVENANIESINNWIASCNENTYKSFITEIEKSSYLREKTKKRLFDIKLFKFSDNNFYSVNDIWITSNVQETYQERTFNELNRASEITNKTRVIQKKNLNDSIIFSTDKTINISNELQYLGFVVSMENIMNYEKIYSALLDKLPKEKDIYIAIAEKCKTNTLTAEEKKNLFLNFINETTKFYNVHDDNMLDLHLFCDSQGDIKSLPEFISLSYKTYFWLNPYMIKSEEYFDELNSFLIQEDELFDKIILLNIEIIKDELTEAKEIKELVNIFKENHRPFFNEYIIQKATNSYEIIDKSDKVQVLPHDKKTKEFIKNYLSDDLIILPSDFSEFNKEDGIIKGRELHIQILDLADADFHKQFLVDFLENEAKHKFLQELSEFRFDSESEYSREDYEYKVLDLACSELKDDEYRKFQNKVIIETQDGDLNLSQIPPFTDKIKIDNYDLSLSEILPDTFHNSIILSNLLAQFINLGLSKEIIGNLFGKNKNDNESFEEILQNIIDETKGKLETPEQVAFVVLYHTFIEENPNYNDSGKFLIKTINGEWHFLYTQYLNYYSFISEDAVLDNNYQKLSEILKINKETKYEAANGYESILIEPYFKDDQFICPYIEIDLTDENKISFIEFIFKQWNKENKKTIIKNINWSKIGYRDTFKILGFDPASSVYPTKYAFKSEVLPDYLIKWIGNDENKIDFLEDFGVCTENSTLVSLRKYFLLKSEFDQNTIAQDKNLSDGKMLINTFEFLKEKEIELKSENYFAVFKEIERVINSSRAEGQKLKIQEEYNYTLLKEESTEWKSIGEFSIYLFNGSLPKILKLNEIQDYIFCHYNDSDYAVNGKNIYINKNEEKTKILQKVALDGNNDFTSEDSKDIELLEVKAELDRYKKQVQPKEDNTNSTFLDEVNDFIESMRDIEDIYDEEKVEELKTILAAFKDQPDGKRKAFNLLAKLKLCKHIGLSYDDGWDFNKVENRNEKYFIHSARGSFAYIHPNEILHMRDEGFKMAIDFGTHDIRIYNSPVDIIELYQNYLMLYQGKPDEADILGICEDNQYKAKFHFLIVDRERQTNDALAILKILNTDSYE